VLRERTDGHTKGQPPIADLKKPTQEEQEKVLDEPAIENKTVVHPRNATRIDRKHGLATNQSICPADHSAKQFGRARRAKD
jgi:hypothetical protein